MSLAYIRAERGMHFCDEYDRRVFGIREECKWCGLDKKSESDPDFRALAGELAEAAGLVVWSVGTIDSIFYERIAVMSDALDRYNAATARWSR